MPQLQLPMFPAGATAINNNIAVQSKDGKVVYLHRHLPVFRHEESSGKSFRYFTSHMIDAGTIQAAHVARTFGVPLATVKRYLKQYRDQGTEEFFQRKPRLRSETNTHRRDQAASATTARRRQQRGRSGARVECTADDAAQSDPEPTARLE